MSYSWENLSRDKQLSFPRTHGTLAYRMDVSVSTGVTKSPRDTSVSSMSLRSAIGETILLLTDIQTRKGDESALERECEAIVRHALVETEGEASQRLDGTLKELNGLFKGLLVSDAIDDMHMLVAILDKEHVMHVSHAGHAEAYLVRKGIASQITEYQSGKPVPAFIHIASGQLESKDSVIFATQRLLRTLTPAQIAKMAEGERLLETLGQTLERDGEHAALATFHMPSVSSFNTVTETPRAAVRGAASRAAMHSGKAQKMAGTALAASIPMARKAGSWLADLAKTSVSKSGSAAKSVELGGIKGRISGFLSDLTDPKRKRRAHFLLIAGAIAALIVVYATVGAFTFTQRSKTKAELEELVQKIDADIQTAENHRLMGDLERANQILLTAENSAEQVVDNESGLFRVEAHNLLARIRSKKEEINNIIRIPAPQVAANIASKSPDVVAEGLIGLADGEFVAYDRQDYYRVVLNSVEDATRLSEDQLILDGENFPRYQATVFLTTGNGVVEVSGGEATGMKTDDPNGWVTGTDMETYLRFLYVLAPESKQIYKYERLNGRYGAPSQYNVNGDLTGALDMTIDGDVYVLKEGGIILKLFRGESQPFNVRKAPADLLKGTTKILKIAEKNFYLLDPDQGRIIVLSDGGATGDASYLKQYVLEGDQVGKLKDIYVDPEETRLYVLDEKRIYVIDLSAH